ncbi:hypothetical protein P12x_000464 [Tundrisphaera lichenicola]|uniref:hypothetical protein n=1 Tax=Tundrisphaera lichenicola TaxID=2029860 RepID=UPI003EB73BA2
MRPAWFLLAIGLTCLSGCTTSRLRQRTINQGGTLPELQYQQVLDNLALFSVNPSSIPWHVNLREGTTQVTDSLSGGALVDLGPPVSTQPQLFGSRTAVAQWGMSPVIDTTELRLLRIAYRRAHGIPDMPDPEFVDELAHDLKDQFASNTDLVNETELFYEDLSRANRDFRILEARTVTANDTGFCGEFGPLDGDRSPLVRNTCRKVESIRRDLARIGPGWFHTGGRRDVPKDACYVGQSGDRYVWVCADGREQLTQFTLTVLKLSSLIKETQTLISPGSVKFSPGDRPG